MSDFNKAPNIAANIEANENETVEIASNENKAVNIAANENRAVNIAANENKAVNIAANINETVEIEANENKAVNVAANINKTVEIAANENKAANISENKAADIAANENEALNIAANENEASPDAKESIKTDTPENKEALDENIKEIPQDSELIKKIVEEAIEFKNDPKFTIPSDALQLDFEIKKNDECLLQTTKDGACLFYSYLYAIFRDPYLKDLLVKTVKKNKESYFISTKIEGEKYTFRIPLTTIQEEKNANRGNLYPCDVECITALGIFLHSVFYVKCGYIDRLAFQPFFITDAFFDQPIINAGFGFSLFKEEDGKDKFSLKNDKNKVDLNEDGSIYLHETKETLVGHCFVGISVFAEGFNFGHVLMVFYDREIKNWSLYNCCPFEDFGEYGEVPLGLIKKTNFNGSCIICSVPDIDMPTK